MQPAPSVTNIRRCLPTDLPAIRAIYNEAILNTTAVYEYQIFSETYIQNWFSEKAEKGHPILVVISGGAVAGFSTYGTFRSRAAYQYTMEHSVYVHPDFRGKGLGKLLLKSIIQQARQDNIHVLIGGIDAANEQSIALHLKEGFQETGRIYEAAFKFGRWLDLVFVQKTLDMHRPPIEVVQK